MDFDQPNEHIQILWHHIIVCGAFGDKHQNLPRPRFPILGFLGEIKLLVNINALATKIRPRNSRFVSTSSTNVLPNPAREPVKKLFGGDFRRIQPPLSLIIVIRRQAHGAGRFDQIYSILSEKQAGWS